MARLAASLTDKCAVRRKIVGPGPKVEGRTLTQTVEGEWTACRLVLAAAGEAVDTGGGRRAVVERAQVVVATRDATGEPVELRASDELEVRSQMYGTGRWRITGSPEPVGARRALAWLVPCERLVEPQRESVA